MQPGIRIIQSLIHYGIYTLGCFLLYSNDVTAQISAAQIVGRHTTVFNAPPSRIPNNTAVDAPLLGNGSCAAAIGGPPEQQQYFLARNDFWRLKSGYNESFPALPGKLQVSIPSLQGASYHVEQKLLDAVTYSSFEKADIQVKMNSWVAATQDLLIVEISNSGNTPVAGIVQLMLPGADQFHINPPAENKFPDTTSKGADLQGMQWLQRGFVKDVDIRSMAAIACKIIGHTSDSFFIQPKEKVTVACSMSGNFKSKAPLVQVKKDVAHITDQSIKQLLAAHLSWWHHYWQESLVAIEDSVIENQYYKSQYTMAACSRDPRFPPGIFGSWVTREIPAWNGDYHLNYNYIAPFYALYSSNHLQQAIPFDAPVLDFMKRGKYYASRITGIPDGVLYPVGIGPLGIETTRRNRIMEQSAGEYISAHHVEDEGLFYGQKSNASYCAVNISQAFYHTYDKQYTQRVYPFIKAVATFWQHYVKKEGNYYVIENDAVHEGTIGNKNPLLSLGLSRMVLQTAIDMAQLLQTDQRLQQEWSAIKDNLAPFPVQTRNGKTVFRYTEKGPDWWRDNTLGIQHIYPAGQIGLHSDSSQLHTSVNTIDEMRRWQDFNGSNSFFPAAVRVGYNADSILTQLRLYSLHTYPNGFQYRNPHGIENCSTVPNTLNEMLCMSDGQILRVFKVWPLARDAAFVNLRSEGAFLVSSTLSKGKILFIKIVSEQGRPLTLENPWHGATVQITSNMKRRLTASGNTIQLPTAKGEVLTISGPGK
ncbi:MAG TPA: hypothetical protein VM802_02740 [Chitinophaga sp.]|uniref:glycosyl hydrolase family 95 catalytic domain-containing protein n=1 Tax=Chitinophaga sp. TaxID=1869181 RepID=UPI002B8D18CE|nr:hypothetical protein [Chitinophaga sp.]HVI43754.1 hypothetical protein [Chitinophaga sp.]